MTDGFLLIKWLLAATLSGISLLAIPAPTIPVKNLPGGYSAVGLTPHCSNEPSSSATHSEASTAPPITPLQQKEAQEPKQMPAIPPSEQTPTEPITTSTPEEMLPEPPEEPPEEPLEAQPEESPTPST